MDLSSVPAWLVSGYVRSLQAIGATADKEDLRMAALCVAQKWGEPRRRFHNLKHLSEMLGVIDQMADSARDPDKVRVAAWYHGLVFNTALEDAGHGWEDPRASAEVCREDLTRLGALPEAVDEICDMLCSLYEHRSVSDVENWQVLSDADLAVFASDPQSYHDYREQLREEYAELGAKDFVSSRLSVIREILGRDQIYYSALAQPWEETARENLQAELEVLAEEEKHVSPVSSVIEEEPETESVVEELSQKEDKVFLDQKQPQDNLNPYAQADQADLTCSMESCENILDTLSFKKSAVRAEELKRIKDLKGTGVKGTELQAPVLKSAEPDALPLPNLKTEGLKDEDPKKMQNTPGSQDLDISEVQPNCS